MIEILRKANVNLRFSLHFGLIFYANIDTVSLLLKASADINEQLEVPMKKTGWWMLLKLLSLRHTVSPSALTYLAYHHSGATPLMLSIITGKFDCASLLLAAGARVDLKNRRGKTAADIARETRAPISLTRAPADETDSMEFDQCDPVVSCAFWSCRLLFATCWNASNQITHHYNRSDHNLYNIYIYTLYIYINLRADSFMFHRVNSAISLCNPTVFLCFMCHQVNGLGESAVAQQISLGISYWLWF